MKKIIHDLIASERCLLNIALILYRDHPPQDSTFVTQVYNFTDDEEEAKKYIDKASASGGKISVCFSCNILNKKMFLSGGDGPEAVAPALYAAVHNLSWRTNAVKIAVLIADAPPHGLDKNGDSWPEGSQIIDFDNTQY